MLCYVGGGPPNSQEISQEIQAARDRPDPCLKKNLEASQGSLIHPGAGPGNLGSDKNDGKKNDKLDLCFFGDVFFYQF